MTDKRILFGDFEFPRTNGLEYLLDEEKLVTDYLFVNEPHEKFLKWFSKTKREKKLPTSFASRKTPSRPIPEHFMASLV